MWDDARRGKKLFKSFCKMTGKSKEEAMEFFDKLEKAVEDFESKKI